MKKYLIAAAISFMIAIENADGLKTNNRHNIPVVFNLNVLPRYGRKRPIRQHFNIFD